MPEYRVIAGRLARLCLYAMALVSCGRTAVPAGEADERQAAELRRVYLRPPADWPKAWLDPGVRAQELAPLPPMTYPARNPWSAQKEMLGRRLFFDPRLSASGQIACASCHDPRLGWTDGRQFAVGIAHAVGVMNTPSIANAGYEKAVFWDGRVASLEAQIPGSLSNPVEMNTPVRRATAAIAAIPAYRAEIAAAYGDRKVDWPRLCDAIATFVRSVQVRDTPYDRFLQGDASALSDAAVRGLDLFRTRARCANCHYGALLSDGQYHHLGTSFYGVGNYQGRYAVTRQASDMGRFRTPGLRGVMRTGPWMHNGLINDVDGLLALYNMGWWQNAKTDAGIDDAMFPKLDPLIRPLHLSPRDVNDLKMFLESMSPPQSNPGSP
jgi:cytochrome c peroxidase